LTARFKSHLLNSALIIASVLLTYFLLEFAFFRLFLPTMPLRLRPHLPDIADVLTQNSKSAFVPHHYIALLGDSYAEGLGDWLWQTKGNRSKPFASANVIHELTGRDVVSFGKGGAGSAEGIVERPAGVFSGASCYLFPAIRAPSQMFIYYYEGNDVEDNINFEIKVQKLYGRVDSHTIDRYLTTQYAAANPWNCQFALLDTAGRMLQFLYEYYVSGVNISYCAAKLGGLLTNRLLVGGRTVVAPALQGPAEDTSDRYIRFATAVLDRSLNWLRHRFAGVPTTVVYVPAPLSVYHFAGDEVSYCVNTFGTASVARTERNSDFISDLVRQGATNQGFGFLDARPALRAAAATTVIHGPKDWDHLNEAGYRALGALIAAHVAAGPGA
jgi:hypothetical protein